MPLIREPPISSAAAFERRLVDEAEGGALVLTKSARLARRILHRHRAGKALDGPCGWAGLRIHGLGAWTTRAHEALWTGTRPLGRAAALRVWHEAAAGVAPPEGLVPGPALYGDLQQALDDLHEHRMPPASGAGGHSLSDWRRAVTERFLKLAAAEGFHVHQGAISSLLHALLEGRVPLPERVVLAEFDAPTPLQADLFDAFAQRSHVVHLTCAAQAAEAPAVQVFGSTLQECRAVCAEVLDAWNEGRTDLGVVYMDQPYFDVLKRCFDELAGDGPPPDLAREIRYNLAGGWPLAEHPLFLTALLPLRAVTESAPAALLASLLCSPYAGIGAGRAAAVREALFAASGSPDLASCLDALGRRNAPVAALGSLASLGRAPLGTWLEALRACWKELGFVTFEEGRRDADAIARRHLDEVVASLAAEAGSVRTSAEGALAWISACAGGLRAAEPTPESAGVQVLAAEEARGLSFAELWIVGATGRTLPRPALDRPLLHPGERRLLPGGTMESRWEEARRDVAALSAGAPLVHWSRPWAGEDEALLPPSPMARDEGAEGAGEGAVAIVDLWNAPPAAWMRARWLRDSLLARSQPWLSRQEEPSGFRLSGEWRVTELGELAACPFRFFAGPVLGLEPLHPASEGLDPLERGTALHAVLAAFATGLAEHVPGWPGANREDAAVRSARAWLEESVEKELSRHPRTLFWEVERLRWMGDSESGTAGVLQAWLEAEQDRAREGWRFAAAESRFAGLRLGPMTLKGRVDRVDHHESMGFTVWDYKSGRAPSAAQVLERWEAPQLPAYLLAVRGGLISEVKAEGQPLQAGYIALGKAGDVAVEPLSFNRRPVNWDEALPAWEHAMEARMSSGMDGLFPADPRPPSRGAFTRRAGACETCPYYDLCGRFDGALERPEAESDEEDAP